ncbi:hypothetical protein ECCB7326_3174, partial [Escherichia coli CB7326]
MFPEKALRLPVISSCILRITKILVNTLSADIFLRPFQLLLHHHQPFSEDEIIPFSGVCQSGAGCI